MTSTTIATWFVSDTPGEESFFPQVGSRSSTPAFQNVYWRCVVCFFTSSRRYNPTLPHVLFTNADLPIVDGMDIGEVLRRLDVEIVTLPITYRLPRSASGSWGNQFYILDIVKHICAAGLASNIIVLDSDCLWNGSAAGISKAIDRYGCLTYTLGEEEYGWEAPINGVTRRRMKQALETWGGAPGQAMVPLSKEPFVQYHGGEIFAGSPACVRHVVEVMDSLWSWGMNQPSDRPAFLEEAHFLSILYAGYGCRPFTAQPFIKRMWTNFRFRNVQRQDLALPVWHLPSEKKTGFARMFRAIQRLGFDAWMAQPDDKYFPRVLELMGLPHRGLSKLTRDLIAKLSEKSSELTHVERAARDGQLYPGPGTKAVVAIATKGRPKEVSVLLDCLAAQTLPPRKIVIVGTEPSDVSGLEQHPLVRSNLARTLIAPKPGLCLQRNLALTELEKEGALPGGRQSAVIFFDDDFRPAPDWIECCVRCFEENADVAGMTGELLADGASGTGLTEEDSKSLHLQWATAPKTPHPGTPPTTPRLYGCNMAIIGDVARAHRFDEALPLLGWLEDADFSGQVRAQGRLVKDHRCIGVHLGSKQGDSSGLRFGYAQIANPLRLGRRRNASPFYIARMIVRALGANSLFSLRAPVEGRADYRGRLRGNLIALYDVLRSRCEPSGMLRLG